MACIIKPFLLDTDMISSLSIECTITWITMYCFVIHNKYVIDFNEYSDGERETYDTFVLVSTPDRRPVIFFQQRKNISNNDRFTTCRPWWRTSQVIVSHFGLEYPKQSITHLCVDSERNTRPKFMPFFCQVFQGLTILIYFLWVSVSLPLLSCSKQNKWIKMDFTKAPSCKGGNPSLNPSRWYRQLPEISLTLKCRTSKNARVQKRIWCISKHSIENPHQFCSDCRQCTRA